MDEWFGEFAADERIKVIWLDIKVDGQTTVSKLIEAVLRLLTAHNVDKNKLIFSANSDRKAAHIRRALSREPLLRSRVVSDTVSTSPYVSKVDEASYGGVIKANEGCGCCVNLGAPPVAINRRSALKTAVRMNVGNRDEHFHCSGKRLNVFVWTIDDPNEMKWLLRSGIDGIITNKPGLLKGLTRGNAVLARKLDHPRPELCRERDRNDLMTAVNKPLLRTIYAIYKDFLEPFFESENVKNLIVFGLILLPFGFAL